MAAKPLTEITPYGQPRLDVHILVPHTRCRHGDVSHVIYHKGRQLLVWPYAVASVGIIFRAADLLASRTLKIFFDRPPKRRC